MHCYFTYGHLALVLVYFERFYNFHANLPTCSTWCTCQFTFLIAVILSQEEKLLKNYIAHLDHVM